MRTQRKAVKAGPAAIQAPDLDADEEDAIDEAMSKLVESNRAVFDAERALMEVNALVPPHLRRSARVVIGFQEDATGEVQPIFAETPEAIDRSMDRWHQCLEKAGADSTAIGSLELFRGCLHGDLERDQRMLSEAGERLGLPQVSERYIEAVKAREAAVVALGRINPTSLKGVQLLAQFAAQSLRSGESSAVYGPAVAYVERALTRLVHGEGPQMLQS